MARSNFARWVAGFVSVAAFAVALPCVAMTQSTSTVLRQMTQSAGVIFAGQVIAVKRPIGYDESADGIVTIEFRVEEAVRGCTSGSVYTLKEWAGLWNGGSGGERYRVGQRLLMFLRQPGASGLSSPVHGVEGAVPLRGGGIAPGPYDTSGETSEWLADLRWVQAQAVRSRGESREPASDRSGVVASSAGRASEVGTGATERLRTVTSPEGALFPVEGGGQRAHWMPLASETDQALQPLSQVLNLCRSWMGILHVER